MNEVVSPHSAIATGGVRQGHVAYLVSEYPAYSHAFIDLEIQALRRHGWRVDTYSVNLPGIPEHPDSASTVASMGTSRKRLVRGLLWFAIRHPRALAKVLARTARYARGRGMLAKRLVWQLSYLAQAVFLHEHIAATEARHIHVHFANNGADIARLIVDVANAVDEQGAWSWSLQVHGPTDFREARSLGLADKIRSATFVTCISAFALAAVREKVASGEWPKLSVVRMGVDPRELQVASAPVGETTDERPFRVLFVGRLVPEKGPDVLLEAVSRMSAGNSPSAGGVELTVIGDGPLRDELQAAASHLPAGVRVNFLGARGHDEVLRWYPWADVFCLPSYSEGLPVVLMEALGSGIPAVTTPVAGIPELVRDGSTGLLVPPGDAVALRAALERLRRDSGLRRRLSDAGRRAVAAEYVAAANAGMLAGLFTECSQSSLLRDRKRSSTSR